MGASQGKGSSEDISTGRAIAKKLGDILRRSGDIPEQRDEASLGILRLDYDYPPAPGDIDHSGSFAYRVRIHLQTLKPGAVLRRHELQG